MYDTSTLEYLFDPRQPEAAVLAVQLPQVHRNVMAALLVDIALKVWSIGKDQFKTEVSLEVLWSKLMQHPQGEHQSKLAAPQTGLEVRLWMSKSDTHSTTSNSIMMLKTQIWCRFLLIVWISALNDQLIHHFEPWCGLLHTHKIVAGALSDKGKRLQKCRS